jgi:hypothetical protein
MLARPETNNVPDVWAIKALTARQLLMFDEMLASVHISTRCTIKNK